LKDTIKKDIDEQIKHLILKSRKDSDDFVRQLKQIQETVKAL